MLKYHKVLEEEGQPLAKTEKEQPVTRGKTDCLKSKNENSLEEEMINSVKDD